MYNLSQSAEKMPKCNDCNLYYVGTGAGISALWLVTLMMLCILRKKKDVIGIKDTTNGCELTPVTDAEKEDTLVYHKIAFTNGKRKPREKNQEEEITYAQVKTTSKQDDGVIYSDVKCNMRRKKTDDAPISSDLQTTYAEIKPKLQQPKPQCSTDLYAIVTKKR